MSLMCRYARGSFSQLWVFLYSVEYVGGIGLCCFFFFFFKQKTAYEIGTGDWSSDVCSSDLGADFDFNDLDALNAEMTKRTQFYAATDEKHDEAEIGRASCRERV